MEQMSTVLAQTLQGRIKALESRALWISLLSLLLTVLLAAGLAQLVFPDFMARLFVIPLRGPQMNLTLLGLVALAFLLNLWAMLLRRALRKARGALMAEMVSRDTATGLALVDSATGTFNRRYLDEVLPRETNRADRRETTLSFVKLGVDDFDSVDARFGYQTSDRVLKEVAQLLKRSFRPTDIIVRYGGDEFMVIMPETGKHGALIAVRRLLDKVDDWNHRKLIPGYEMTLSVGVADYIKGTDIRDVLAATDHRVQLYRERRTATE